MNSPYSKVLSLSWFFSIKLHWMTSDSRILHTSICLNLDLNSVHNERPAENELHCKMWKRNRNYPFGDRLTWLWSGSSSIGFATATETSLHSRRILRRANSALIICFLLRFDLIFEFQLNFFFVILYFAPALKSSDRLLVHTTVSWRRKWWLLSVSTCFRHYLLCLNCKTRNLTRQILITTHSIQIQLFLELIFTFYFQRLFLYS